MWGPEIKLQFSPLLSTFERSSNAEMGVADGNEENLPSRQKVFKIKGKEKNTMLI